jgi:hypothetical protein
MARGIRSDTPERIALAREKNPLSLGPLFGELATYYNMSAGMVASIIKAHEQTVLRWFFGRSEMQPVWIKTSVKLLGLLAWMYAAKKEPLSGSAAEKEKQLAIYFREFKELSKT